MNWNFGTLHYTKPERFELRLPLDKSYAEFIELAEQSFAILGYYIPSPPIPQEDHWLVVFKRSA